MTCPTCGTENQATSVTCAGCQTPLTPAVRSLPGATVTADPLTKECPFCSETIKRDAVKCRYCGSALTMGAAAAGLVSGAAAGSGYPSPQPAGGNIVLNAPSAGGSADRPSIIIQNVQASPVMAAQGLALKNPGLATLLSFFMSGLGQIYNGQVGKGILLIVLQTVNVMLMFVGIGVFTGFIVWVYGMADAHTTAAKINARGY